MTELRTLKTTFVFPQRSYSPHEAIRIHQRILLLVIIFCQLVLTVCFPVNFLSELLYGSISALLGISGSMFIASFNPNSIYYWLLIPSTTMNGQMKLITRTPLWFQALLGPLMSLVLLAAITGYLTLLVLIPLIAIVSMNQWRRKNWIAELHKIAWCIPGKFLEVVEAVTRSLLPPFQ